MTKLQELMLRRKRLAQQQTEVYEKYGGDVSAIPAEEQEEIRMRNKQLVEMDDEIKKLSELEEMKRVATTEFRHNADDNSRRSSEADNKGTDHERESVRIKSLPRFGTLKHFKGEDAMLRAYQFGMWFAGAVLHDKYPSTFTQKARQYCADWGLQTKAQSEGINTAGGYLVPPDFANDIIDLRELFGVFRRNTRVIPMARETKSIPRRVTGLTVFYPGEGVGITESQKAWDMVSMTARKYACLTVYSSELFEDAIISIGDDLAGEIGYAFALAEDTNGFNGDGTSAFAGTTGVRQRLFDVYGASGGVGLVVGAGNAYSELILGDFNKVVGALPEYADGRARWFCSRFFWATVMQRLALAAGGVTAEEVEGRRMRTFLGYPVEVSQVFPKMEANSQIPLVFGDLARSSKLGDRRELTIAFSDQYKFAEDQLAIKGTQRIDINVHDVGDSVNAGPIVGLIMAAA